MDGMFVASFRLVFFRGFNTNFPMSNSCPFVKRNPTLRGKARGRGVGLTLIDI